MMRMDIKIISDITCKSSEQSAIIDSMLHVPGENMNDNMVWKVMKHGK